MTDVDFSKIKFPVAEDNRFLREICRTILSSYGARDVVEAIDGAEALESFKERAPDIIIFDLHMPILDGFDVLRMLRHQATSSNFYVPVIVMWSRTLGWRDRTSAMLQALQQAQSK